MALSDEELAAIQERNQARKELKESASPGPWSYDSWAFVHQSERIPRSHRLGIVVRPMTWFDALGNRIEEGIPQEPLIQQAYQDADYIAKSRDDGAERDIDALIAEVRILRASSK